MSTVASVRVIASSVMLSAREVSEAIDVNCETRETNETHDMLVVDLLPLLDELTTSLILLLTSSIELIIEDKAAILLANSAADRLAVVKLPAADIKSVVGCVVAVTLIVSIEVDGMVVGCVVACPLLISIDFEVDGMVADCVFAGPLLVSLNIEVDGMGVG